MGLKLTKKTARFLGICSVEEAEALLDWTQGHSAPRADLSGCEHLHAALLQILLAREVEVVGLPQDPWLSTWLRPLVKKTPAVAVAASPT